MVSEKILKEMRKVALRLQDSRTFRQQEVKGRLKHIYCGLGWIGDVKDYIQCRCPVI